jgi:putative transposase
VPVGLAVGGANRNDHLLLRETFDSIPVERPEPTEGSPQHLGADKGYDYPAVDEAAAELGLTPHIVRRGEDPKAKPRVPGYRARRWVVERLHSWMNRFRRVLIRWEKKPENYIAFLHLACAVITYRCAGLIG